MTRQDRASQPRATDGRMSVPPHASPLVIVALLTPFDDRGVSTTTLSRHVEHLLESGIDGVMPCGTTGEGPLLADHEILAVVDTVVGTVDGRVPVIAHVGRVSTRATVDLARGAVARGASAVSAVVPWYYALTDDQVVRHYVSLLAADLGIPVYAYTIPGRSGNDISLSTATRLAEEGLYGIKDSTKSFARHMEFLSLELTVLMGSDGLILDSWRAGSAGCVSTIANVNPVPSRKAERHMKRTAQTGWRPAFVTFGPSLPRVRHS